VVEAAQRLDEAVHVQRAVETVTTKPFFREAFKRTRCIIPASGYYEWQDTADGKQPHYFTRADGQVISFAGLWDEWKDRATGETLKSCTMIITEPNAMVAEVHDRMPVVLRTGSVALGRLHRVRNCESFRMPAQ
jgi:putative SOS response-associated peptidase YedK